MKRDLARSKMELPDEVRFRDSLEGRKTLGYLSSGEEWETEGLKGCCGIGMTLEGSRGKSERDFCLGMGGRGLVGAVVG
jgi:hypothetical protein